MTNEDVAAALSRLEQIVVAQGRRIDMLEESQKDLRELIRSVDNLAHNMKTMADKQEHQGKQLDTLETTKADSKKYWFRTIFASAATGAVAYILSQIVNNLGI